ncbi:hypothetical protein [Sorangium sp. So ce1099]|uniref:hypothetical protein n=1 Tax=Sorangium sp. So ce1099 TaxID=3133331 RepID=UPI003F62EBBE
MPADRSLTWDGCLNVRDLGGLSTVTGRTVEPRELFAVYPSRRLLPSRVRLALDWVMKHG